MDNEPVLNDAAAIDSLVKSSDDSYAEWARCRSMDNDGKFETALKHADEVAPVRADDHLHAECTKEKKRYSETLEGIDEQIAILAEERNATAAAIRALDAALDVLNSPVTARNGPPVAPPPGKTERVGEHYITEFSDGSITVDGEKVMTERATFDEVVADLRSANERDVSETSV